MISSEKKVRISLDKSGGLSHLSDQDWDSIFFIPASQVWVTGVIAIVANPSLDPNCGWHPCPLSVPTCGWDAQGNHGDVWGNSTWILTLQARVCLSEAADRHHELGASDQRLQGDDLGRFCGKEVAAWWKGVSTWVSGNMDNDWWRVVFAQAKS